MAPARWPAVLGLALAGMLVLGVSGAITALGDTLFPAASLAEGKAQTFSDTAHVFLRLRLWHPVLALTAGALVLAAALHAVRGGADRRCARGARRWPASSRSTSPSGW